MFFYTFELLNIVMISGESSSQPPVFFIIGRPRSGTSLLRYLFDAHPNVSIPTECNFILFLSSRYKNIRTLDEDAIRQFIGDLKSSKHFDALTLDFTLLEEKLRSLPSETSYQAICSQVQLSYQSVHEKSEIMITGDKNPGYSSDNFPRIYKLFPDARYIHLVRDYHDHIASMLKGNFLLSSAIYLAIAWKKSVKILDKYKKKNEGNFYTVRYEDFVEHPEESMKDICSFLQLPYKPETFDFYLKKDDYLKSQPSIDFAHTHKSLFNPVNKARVGKWEDVIRGNDLAAVEIVAGKTGKRFGYESTKRSLNLKLIYLLLKWKFYYFVAITFKAYAYSLPLNRRNGMLQRFKKNRFIISWYSRITHRNIQTGK
jgi:hypothetical protein